MNLQESIRRILKEENTLPNLIRRRFSEEELYKLVSNVERTFETHRISQQHREDVIDAEVDDFIMNSVYYSEFEDFDDEIYQDIYNLYREPLVDYIKSKIDMNLQESIRKVLREEKSNRTQEKLKEMIKTLGVVLASKAVGGLDNLVKKLGLEMDDLKTQEMLAKSFIYHTDIEDVDILHLEINRDRPDKVRIKIHFNINNPASNMESWLVRTLCHEMNKFFPFKTAAFWEPAFAGRGVTVILDSEQIVNGDDEEID
jgi:hypothetical protein